MACAAIILYIAINDVIFILFPMKRKSIGMGLATSYGALLFGVLILLSMFVWDLKSLRAILLIITGLLVVFGCYWARIIPSYPYRATCLLLSGAGIYLAMHGYLYWKRIYK